MAKIIYPIYFILGFLPSLIWLLFYLQEDIRPEPKKEVAKVFILGMVVALPAAFFEFLILREISNIIISPILISILSNFLVIAGIEEIAKYSVVKKIVLKSPELDEPVDLIIYMMISGLGFAATENILLLFSKKNYLTVLIGRFLSATFLHALCSGILGFFLAFSFFSLKRKFFYLFCGFSIAILLHGFYNLSIMEIEGNFKLLAIGLILISSAILLKFFFKTSKKIKSICKI